MAEQFTVERIPTNQRPAVRQPFIGDTDQTFVEEVEYPAGRCDARLNA